MQGMQIRKDDLSTLIVLITLMFAKNNGILNMHKNSKYFKYSNVKQALL